MHPGEYRDGNADFLRTVCFFENNLFVKVNQLYGAGSGHQSAWFVS